MSKLGDLGKTNIGNRRLWKTNKFVKLLGDLDELMSYIALVKISTNQEQTEMITKIWDELRIIGGFVAGYNSMPTTDYIDKQTEYIKGMITIPHEFISAKSENSAKLQISRSICRRAERSAWECNLTDVGRYLNHLGLLLFYVSIWID